MCINTTKQKKQFIELRSKFRAVRHADDEVEGFKTRNEEDDSNFIVFFEQSEGFASEIKKELVKACKELEHVCLKSEGFNELVLNSV